ncbi:hypothetical protein MG295_00022 [Bacillus phage vB_BcgM]|nr:hypothetical protein MG295_00022 [Bacillus phage vB_BcgM]
MDELKAVTEEVIKERIKERHSDATRLTKDFAAIEGHDMYKLEKKEVILKRVAMHKRMIEKLNELLYDISKIDSDLEANQLLDSIMSDRKRMRDHIEKAAVISILLYEDYMDYAVHNKLIGEVSYIKITVRKTMEGEL